MGSVWGPYGVVWFLWGYGVSMGGAARARGVQGVQGACKHGINRCQMWAIDVDWVGLWCSYGVCMGFLWGYGVSMAGAARARGVQGVQGACRHGINRGLYGVFSVDWMGLWGLYGVCMGFLWGCGVSMGLWGFYGGAARAMGVQGVQGACKPGINRGLMWVINVD